MQALEWTILGGDFVSSAVVIGCGARHTAWQIGISETQRQAIYADPKWKDGDFDLSDPPTSGLSVARQIAMISYRSAKSYELKFGREVDPKSGGFQVQSYLHYQGQKFLDRFDALTYVRLTEQMDTHDVARGRGYGDGPNALETVLGTIRCPVLVLGMDSDLLYPLEEQQYIARHIPHAKMGVVHSLNGHDGFLLEQDQVGNFIHNFLLDVNITNHGNR